MRGKEFGALFLWAISRITPAYAGKSAAAFNDEKMH